MKSLITITKHKRCRLAANKSDFTKLINRFRSKKKRNSTNPNIRPNWDYFWKLQFVFWIFARNFFGEKPPTPETRATTKK